MTGGAVSPQFEVRVGPGPAPGSRTIQVQGELDSGTCPELTGAAERELSDSELERLVLDLKDMTFVDSSGMRAIIQLEREASQHGVAVEVVPAREEVTALLRVAGVTQRMHLVTEPAAEPLPEEFLEQIDVELVREPHAPSEARAEVRQALGPTMSDHDLGMLVLLTSEVVTNAVIHPRETSDARLGLRTTVYPDRVRVEVDDPGEGFDPGAPLQPTERGGRGLMLVDSGAVRWGAGTTTTPRGERFAVWFELRHSPPGARAVGE